MSSNPYETSFSDHNTQFSNLNPQSDTNSGIDLDVKEAMLSLARWQTFFAVLGTIMSGLIMLLMIGQMMFLATGTPSGMSGLGATAFMFVIMALFYVLPTIRLFQATAAIRKFRTDQASLRTVMETQRSFWRTIGVLAIVGISLYVVVIFFMFSVAAFGSRF
jgi:ABC-type multidrug transport system fused ATPase/permease subunit